MNNDNLWSDLWSPMSRPSRTGSEWTCTCGHSRVLDKKCWDAKDKEQCHCGLEMVGHPLISDRVRKGCFSRGVHW